MDGGDLPGRSEGTSGRLFIVATPIGSLGDLAPRAQEVLAGVELILAEDTRRTRILLSYAGIAAGRRLRSLRRENEERLVPSLVVRLVAGLQVALVCDAGTPVLSDPGFILVREARRHGVAVSSVPGPSAFTAALAASGQPPLPATLVGYLPPRPGPRRERVAELAALPWTLVVLLSPHRLRNELSDLAEGLGPGRSASLLVELSKLHERVVLASLGELASSSESERPRGEYVVVIGPREQPSGVRAVVSRQAVRDAYERALAAGEDRRKALLVAARRLDLSRREAYRLLHEDGPDEVC